MASAPHVRYYFAYGANMNNDVLRRRGVQLLDWLPARVASASTWLAFSHRAGYATLLECPHGPPTGPAAVQQPYGRLCLLSDRDFQKLARAETGYGVATLQVQVLPTHPASATAVDDVAELQAQLQVLPPLTGHATAEGEGMLIAAQTFLSDPWSLLPSPVTPTSEYKATILQGAVHSSLPPAYLTLLQQLPELQVEGLGLPTAYYNTKGNAVGRAVFLACCLAALSAYVAHM